MPTPFLPPIPAPPHDPTWWRLDARVGWRAAVLDGLASDGGCLVLAPEPGTARTLTEPSGSFGGLVAPTNVACAPDGSLYLLDRRAGRLKRFDGCACRFEVVPCLGGLGPGPRQVQGPVGLGICGQTLFVCDAGNHRLSVFALPEMTLRGHWAPPPAAAQPWTPWAVAFDRRGRVFVTDRANGLVHRFSPTGHWEAAFAGLGLATHLVIDGRERLYIVLEGDATLRVLDRDGHALGTVTRPDEIDVAPLAFTVDAAGRLHLGVLCTDDAAGDGLSSVFDLSGDPVLPAPPSFRPRYGSEGLYLSAALDSALYRCTWHRVVLDGDVPAGTSIGVTTYTSEALLPDAHVQALPERAWDTNLTVREIAGGTWDGLVRSQPGRYLWLRLRFRGTGEATPTLRAVRVEFPRIPLRRYLPAVFGEDPVGADFTDRLLAVFDTTLRGIEHEIDTQARLYDPRSAPAETGADFLAWLASWIGVTLERQWPEARRRRVLAEAGRLFALRGTREGLWRQLLVTLGFEPERVCCTADAPRVRCRPTPAGCRPPEPRPCTWTPPPLILEHFKLRRWLFLGAGRLGDQAVLWGQRIVNRSQLGENAQVGGTQLITTQDPFRDPFHVYAHTFSVFVPASYGRSPRHRRALENLVRSEKPAHTRAHVVYVEPRFRIGFQSMIGLDAVVGRYPEGVTLGETALGGASVLSAGAPDTPTLRVGARSRIGTTTLLD